MLMYFKKISYYNVPNYVFYFQTYYTITSSNHRFYKMYKICCLILYKQLIPTLIIFLYYYFSNSTLSYNKINSYNKSYYW